MAKRKEPIKKVIMKYLWRIQQAQMVISMVFWSLTLTGVFYEYFKVKFNNFGIDEDNVFGGMLVLFFIVIFSIIIAGFIYDKLKFWKEQQFVIVERNPYTSWKLNPVFTQWADLWVEMAKSMENKTPELEAKINFFEAWVNRCQEIDPWTTEMRELTRKFALEKDDTVMKAFAGNS